VAELVGAFAASHAPLIARDWALFSDGLKQRLERDFRELGRRLAAVRADVLVVVAPDHWTNFFLDNLPNVCVGIGAVHGGPPEPFLRDFPFPEPAGDPGFGEHLVATALAAGFEPAVSHHARLDHGICLPLLRMGLPALPRIVPLWLNSLEPPMPALGRCLAWGGLLRDAVASYPAPVRVAVLASGGLSHSIGEPTMGAIDEPFDRECLAAFTSGDPAALTAFLDARLAAAGNGAHEVRNWLVAHAAAGNAGFELIDYLAVAEVYVGCAWGSWRITPKPAPEREPSQRGPAS
jgi:aromatic ring-opening dioxygenase catalytic subunit (LigB family)